MDEPISLLRFPERNASWQRALPYAVLIAVTFALYGPSLYFDFAWDDTNYILNNYWIQGLSLDRFREIWTRSYMGNYAPLHHLAMAFVYSLWGMEPFGFHLVQVFLHAACVCALFFVLQEIESPAVAWLASLLFAVYPPNIENVAWVSEIKTTMALLFFLLSFWAFHRLRTTGDWQNGVWSAIFLTLSLLSKINTVVAPAVFLLYDYKRHDANSGRFWNKNRLRSLIVFFLLGAAFTVGHLFSSQGLSRSSPQWLVDASLTNIPLTPAQEQSGYFGGFWVHLLNLPFFLFFYIRMVLFPGPLSAWQMFPIRAGLDWTVVAAWVGLAALAWIVYRSPRHIQFWILWFFLFLAPVLQLVPNAIWVADRYLYVPAIGAFVLAGKLALHVLERIPRLRLRLSWEAAICLVLLALAWQTHAHLPVWRNDLTLWGATTRTCRTSAYCHYRLGIALLDEGRVDPGVLELSQAVRIRPALRYLLALGDALTDNAGDYERALRAYQLARESGTPLSVTFLAKVAKAQYLSGDLEQARSTIATGQNIQPDNSALLLVEGFVEWKLGDREASKEALRKGLALNSVNPLARHPARFLNDYWKRPAEVGLVLSDLGLF